MEYHYFILIHNIVLELIEILSWVPCCALLFFLLWMNRLNKSAEKNFCWKTVICVKKKKKHVHVAKLAYWIRYIWEFCNYADSLWFFFVGCFAEIVIKPNNCSCVKSLSFSLSFSFYFIRFIRIICNQIIGKNFCLNQNAKC